MISKRRVTATVSIYDKTNDKWFEPQEIKSFLEDKLSAYNEKFELSIF